MPTATKHRRRVRRRKKRALRWMPLVLIAAILLGVGGFYYSPHQVARRRVERLAATQPLSGVEYLPIDIGKARSGRPLEGLKGIVIHYVGNPGTSARNNRDYFAQENTEVCSHYVVGLAGEIVQCLPLDERSAASNHRNRDTISIEVCHPDESGKFTPTTYTALVELTAWLCKAGDMPPEQVIRHYDVTGKLCPLYYVEHEGEWRQFLADVAERAAAI